MSWNDITMSWVLMEGDTVIFAKESLRVWVE